MIRYIRIKLRIDTCYASVSIRLNQVNGICFAFPWFKFGEDTLNNKCHARNGSTKIFEYVWPNKTVHSRRNTLHSNDICTWKVSTALNHSRTVENGRNPIWTWTKCSFKFKRIKHKKKKMQIDLNQKTHNDNNFVNCHDLDWNLCNCMKTTEITEYFSFFFFTRFARLVYFVVCIWIS